MVGSTKTDPPLPALRRDLEAVPAKQKEKDMFLLQDLEGLCEHNIMLSPIGMLVASLLNGKRSTSELQSLFTKLTGTLLNHAEIHQIVESLEKSNLLETPKVQAKRQQILEEFLASPLRKATLQGVVYPKDALELAGFLGRFFRDPKGPGKLVPDRPSYPSPPLGLISPHIDFHRGGPAYAWAYQALAESPPPDLIVALGSAHAAPNSPWSMTQKAYETPYGPLPVSSDLYNEMKGFLWYDPNDDEWVHRREHSLEFQAVWLKFLWRDKTPPWVPILCSTFERFCPDRPPSSVGTVEDAIQKIGERLAKRTKAGQKIMLLAAVDLAHVGPRFGDEIALGREVEERIESEDRGSLEHALHLDADQFYLSVIANGHWRKVCGLSALYTSLRWIKTISGDQANPGKLLTYGQAPDPMGGIVSFASGIFQRS